MITPITTPQKAPLTLNSDMPLAVNRKVSAGASIWDGSENATLIDAVSAGISASPATAVINPAGASAAIFMMAAEKNASKIYAMPAIIAAQYLLCGFSPASSPHIIAAVIADMFTGTAPKGAMAVLNHPVVRSSFCLSTVY